MQTWSFNGTCMLLLRRCSTWLPCPRLGTASVLLQPQTRWNDSLQSDCHASL